MTAPNVAVGWKGFLLVGNSTSILPYVSEDITEKNTHIPSEDVHGGGIGAQTTGPFYSELNVADGPLTYDGTINAHVYASSNSFGSATKDLFKKAIDATDRLMGFETATPLVVSPGGAGETTIANAFAYPGSTVGAESIDRCVVQNLNVKGSAGNLIDFDITVVSTTRDPADTTKAVVGDLEFESIGANMGLVNPVAWHQINITTTSLGETLTNRITEFSLAVDNNTIPIDSFNRARTRRDIYQGLLNVTGTLKYYAPTGTFEKLNRIGGAVDIKLGLSGQIQLTVNQIALDPAPIPGPGPNELTYREISYRGIAASGLPSLTLTTL